MSIIFFVRFDDLQLLYHGGVIRIPVKAYLKGQIKPGLVPAGRWKKK